MIDYISDCIIDNGLYDESILIEYGEDIRKIIFKVMEDNNIEGLTSLISQIFYKIKHD